MTTKVLVQRHLSDLSSQYLKPMNSVYLLAFICLPFLVGAVPDKAKSPDLKATLQGLSSSTQKIDPSKDPIDYLDQVKVWEKIIQSCKDLDKVLVQRIQGVSEQLEEYEVKAEKFPSKAEFYQKLSSRVEGQLDQLYGIKRALSVGSKKLQKNVDFVRSDPEIAELLDLQSKQEKFENQLVLPDEIIPDKVKRAIDKATE